MDGPPLVLLYLVTSWAWLSLSIQAEVHKWID